jgi:hypothetical protein
MNDATRAPPDARGVGARAQRRNRSAAEGGTRLLIGAVPGHR